MTGEESSEEAFEDSAGAPSSHPTDAPTFDHSDIIAYDAVDRSFAHWLSLIAAAGGTRCDGSPLTGVERAHAGALRDTNDASDSIAALALVRIMGIADVPDMGSRLRIQPNSGVVVEVLAETVTVRDDDDAMVALAQLSGGGGVKRRRRARGRRREK